MGERLNTVAPRSKWLRVPIRSPAAAAFMRVPNPGGEQLGNGRINTTPHVNHNQWYGHDSPNDSRYHLERPFARGAFRGFGPGFRYRFLRVDSDRHWFWFPGGFYFEVAPWDWPFFVDWCGIAAMISVVYEDPDHIGWYLLYNMHTGAYVHVQYMGM